MDSNYSKTFAACNANSTDILTNLAIEIVQDCRKLNQTVDYNVAFVIIDLLTLNNKRKAASLFDRKEIQLLKQKCISILSGKNSTVELSRVVTGLICFFRISSVTQSIFANRENAFSLFKGVFG